MVNIRVDLPFLYRAAYNGHFDVIRVLAAYGADLGKVASDGNTPLHYAAQQGFGPICKFLSQRGKYHGCIFSLAEYILCWLCNANYRYILQHGHILHVHFLQ